MHIEKIQLQKFQQNQLDTDEYLTVLEHVATCTFCANALADVEMEHAAIEAPKNLKDQIMVRAKQPDVVISAKVKQTSRKMQMLVYGARTVTAVIIALFLLNVVSHFQMSMYGSDTGSQNGQRTDYVTQEEKEPGWSQQITLGIGNGSRAVLNEIANVSNYLIGGGK